MSRIKGGINTTTIRVSEKYNYGFKREIDILLLLDLKVEDLVKSSFNNKEQTLIKFTFYEPGGI